jgi:Glycosyltransferase family 28 C-terminal domain
VSARLAVSYAWGNQGLGHASRLIAVHAALRERGWTSLFFTDETNRLLTDYGFEQVLLPMYRESILGEAWSGSVEIALRRLAESTMSDTARKRAVALLTAPTDHRRRLAELIVEESARHADLVLHDVMVHGALYAHAAARGVPQAFLHRPRRDRPDPAAWVTAELPEIRTVYALGGPVPDPVSPSPVRVRTVADVVRRPLGDNPVWGPGDTGLRIAVTAGGGGYPDAESFLDAAVAGVASFLRGTGRPASVLVVPGPYFTGRLHLVADPRSRVTVTGYVDPRHSIYRDTDLLVSQGGYNTVQELLHRGIPAVAVPGERMLDDQHGRLNKVGAAGRVRVAAASPEEIAAALTDVAALAAEPPRPTPEPPGAHQIADDLTTSPPPPP